MRQDTMLEAVSKQELDSRVARFCAAMDLACPDWDTAIFLSRVNQYYFCGTMQDAALVIPRGGQARLFVRRSYERARAESPMEDIYPIESYRDAAAQMGRDLGRAYIEAEIATLAVVERLKKHFDMAAIGALDDVIMAVRAVKSAYERHWIERSGAAHREFLLNAVPSLLKEGISEAEFAGALFEGMIRHGYQGISRFYRFQTEMVVGQIGFGESSLYPTSFDGPGGALGMSAAVPLLGNRDRRLKKGDLVFVDVAFGMNGYHSDRTQVYIFGGQAPEAALKAHRMCIELQRRLAERLIPGAVPEDVYLRTLGELSADDCRDLMGFGQRRARFFGHGVGLQIDEFPVIAQGFKAPLEENMVIALEPKKGVAGVGMVGVEDTYIVERGGGRCVTGGGMDIIRV